MSPTVAATRESAAQKRNTVTSGSSHDRIRYPPDSNASENANINDKIQQESLRNKVETTMSSLPSYPLLDTFSLLAILTVFPYFMSLITLMLYLFFGNPNCIDIMLSFFVKHKLNRKSAYNKASLKPNAKRFSLATLSSYILIDAVIMMMIFKCFPSAIPYVILFSKAFIASNLTSLRQRYVIDAMLSCLLLLTLENLALYMIKHFEIFRTDSMFSSHSTYTSLEYLYPMYYDAPSNLTKLFVFNISFHSIHPNSILMIQIEYAIQFLHATLSLYVILHNINPIIRKNHVIDRFYILFENLILLKSNGSSGTNKPSTDLKNSPISNFDKKPTSDTYHVPDKIANSMHPSLVKYTETEEFDENDDILNAELNNPFTEKFPQRTESDSKDTNDELPDVDISDDSIIINKNEDNEANFSPGAFPPKYQELNIDDVSSPTFVVSQNFETFCKMIWFTSSDVTPIPTSNSPNQIESKTLSLQQSASTTYPKSRNASKRIILKPKSVEKKGKINVLKFQQPLWTFLNAARTMFMTLDYYSGDYYSHSAIIPAGESTNDYNKKTLSSSQCYVWHTGESTLAFELHNICLEQLLIRVNGVIWEHVTSYAVCGREMIVVTGLSPLLQYDVEFVKITLNGELVHLTTATVSTIFRDKVLSGSQITSPLKTLQESVQYNKAFVESEFEKVKNAKATWKKDLQQIKNEIENLNNRSNTSDESRQYKKLDNLRVTVSKIEKEIQELRKKTEEYSNQLDAIEEKHKEAQRKYENESRNFNKFKQESQNSALELEAKIKSLRAEKNQLLVKKEKVISKKLRIHHDVELLENELETTKKTEVALRVEKRKIRSFKREEKYNLLVKDISQFEQQLKAKTLNGV